MSKRYGNNAYWVSDRSSKGRHYCSICGAFAKMGFFGKEKLTKVCPNCGRNMERWAWDD